MKKVCTVFLLAAMLLSLCACGKDAAQTTTDPTQSTACSHNFADATCTTPKTCTLCGVTEGETVGHTLTAVCTACGKTNAEYVDILDANWVCKEEANGTLVIATYYFYSEDGEQAVDLGYNQYKTLEKLAQETGQTVEELRAEYAEYEMLYDFNGVEYAYDGWGMDNWSGRRFTEENGVLTIEFLSLDWNEADEEVWTVECTAVLTRTGFAEWTVTGGDYCTLGLKLTPSEE